MLSATRGFLASPGGAARTATIRRRGFSSTTGISPTSSSPPPPSSSSASSSPLVLSRRVWQSHFEKLPKKPKAAKVKPDDKPWPRNVQIAGGVAAGLFIPYTTVWLISSNPTLREVFGLYLPLDRLRTHFGVLEPDSQSFADQIEDEEGGSGDNNNTGEKGPPAGFYQYPLEDSFRDRQQQSTIEALDSGTIAANIYILGDSDDSQVQETKQVPASIKANPQTLAELVGISSSDTTGTITRVAVDFVDSDDANSDEDNMSSDLNVDGSAEYNNMTRSTRDLLKRMDVFSTWHYAHSFDEEGNDKNNNNKNQKASDAVEIDRLRLEYTVDKLEKDLRDPNCTRDHDQMREELKEAKRDLSRLKWKRRLGFA